MTEAEVILRTATFLFEKFEAVDNVQVSIDGQCNAVYSVRDYFQKNKWQRTSSCDGSRVSWTGIYEKGDRKITVRSINVLPDVVATIGPKRRFLAECKKRSGAQPENTMRHALGQLITHPDYSPIDYNVVSIPFSENSLRWAREWTKLPHIKTAGSKFALVHESGTIDFIE